MKSLMFALFAFALVSCTETVTEIKEVPIEQSVPITDDSSNVVISRTVDGDTYAFQYRGEEFRIRHLYIDTWETANNSRARDQAELLGVTPDSIVTLGKQVKAFTESLINGKTVTIFRDSTNSNMDSFGRLLRYVVLDDGRRLDSLLLSLNYAILYQE